jgi:hypothetical protein
MGYEGVDWIKLALHRLHWLTFVNTVMNLRELQPTEDFIVQLSDY